jgi:hypothetical protein
MHIDVDTFDEDQKKLLSLIVSDLDGPTMAATLLMILEEAIYLLKPDFELSSPHDNEQKLWGELEVCLAALQYWKVKNAVGK